MPKKPIGKKIDHISELKKGGWELWKGEGKSGSTIFTIHAPKGEQRFSEILLSPYSVRIRFKKEPN